MLVWLKRLSAVSLLAFFSYGTIWFNDVVSDASLFPIKTVKVEGMVQHIDQAALNQAIAEDLQKSFFMLDVHSIQQHVESMPWVADVTVARSWPGTLKLTIDEQVPVAIWNWKGLVNREGHHFKEDDLFAFANLPVLLGADGDQKALVDKLFELQEIFNVDALRVRELEIDQRLAWRVKLQNGIEVKLSDTTDSRLIKQFIKAYQDNTIVDHDKISAVDLRYQNGFSVKWTPGA